MLDLSELVTIDQFKELIIKSKLQILEFVNCRFASLDYIVAIAPLVTLLLTKCKFEKANGKDLFNATVYCETYAICPAWTFSVDTIESAGLLFE